VDIAMKKTILIFVSLILFISFYSLLCFNADTDEQMYELNASGRDYHVDYYMLYNKIAYFDDLDKSSITETDIKWNNIFAILAAVGISAYILIEHKRKYGSETRQRDIHKNPVNQ
jgi:sugar phosphate isomerase/epimerase